MSMAHLPGASYGLDPAEFRKISMNLIEFIKNMFKFAKFKSVGISTLFSTDESFAQSSFA